MSDCFKVSVKQETYFESREVEISLPLTTVVAKGGKQYNVPLIDNWNNLYAIGFYDSEFFEGRIKENDNSPYELFCVPTDEVKAPRDDCEESIDRAFAFGKHLNNFEDEMRLILNLIGDDEMPQDNDYFMGEERWLKEARPHLGIKPEIANEDDWTSKHALKIGFPFETLKTVKLMPNLDDDFEPQIRITALKDGFDDIFTNQFFETVNRSHFFIRADGIVYLIELDSF